MAHVLYIEDDVTSISLVKKVLNSNGHKVMWAFDGQEGLDLAMAHPGLILLDVKLPDMDGYEVARRLRACGNSHLAYVPIIAVTGYNRDGEADRALDAGCDVYMTKPFNIRELSARVEAFLPSKHRYGRDARGMPDDPAAASLNSSVDVVQSHVFPHNTR